MRQEKTNIFMLAPQRENMMAQAKVPLRRIHASLLKERSLVNLRAARENTCHFCQKEGHYKDCPNFLKLMLKKVTNKTTFVD